MGDNTGIEWAEATWNPTTGCDKVSPGCKNCYAERVSARMKAMGQRNYARGFELTLHPHMLDTPLRWARPRTIFVDSMSDLFHDDVPATFIAAVFGVMALACHHRYLVLTKRADRMAAVVPLLYGDRGDMGPCWVALDRFGITPTRAQTKRIRDALPPGSPLAHDGEGPLWPLPHVALGVSVESQRYADERIPLLLETPAAIRFLSCEPLLGPLALDAAWKGTCATCGGAGEMAGDPFDDAGVGPCPAGCRNGTDPNNEGIDWLIAGGESGPGARPMQPTWARSLRDQCANAGSAFHFKQWGAWMPVEVTPGAGCDLTEAMGLVGKHRAGRVLDGRTHDDGPPWRLGGES